MEAKDHRAWKKFGPQGHDWQDLWWGLVDIATYLIHKAVGLMVSEKIFLKSPL